MNNPITITPGMYKTLIVIADRHYMKRTGELYEITTMNVVVK